MVLGILLVNEEEFAFGTSQLGTIEPSDGTHTDNGVCQMFH